MIQKFNDRNKDIKVWIDGVLLHRDYAKISVFDSVVQGGDAVWEGLRVYNGRIFYFDKHIDRLMESAKSMNFINVPTTLLSQVDSSIGGKTGVNTKEGKNLIGSFYQPKIVISDTDFLKSLSKREIFVVMAKFLNIL